MEYDRTGVYETYYISKDQIDKSCYMKIDFVDFNNSANNHTDFYKFSDFDLERIYFVEDFLLRKEIKSFINTEDRYTAIPNPNPKKKEKLEDFDDITSIKEGNCDIYYKNMTDFGRDRLKFIYSIRDYLYYYSENIDSVFMEAYTKILNNFTIGREDYISNPKYLIEEYTTTADGSRYNMKVLRCYKTNDIHHSKILTVVFLSDNTTTAYEIIVDDSIFKQRFLTTRSQDFSNEKFEYKLYFHPMVDELAEPENDCSSTLKLFQINRKWYREMVLDRDADKMKIEVTINTSQSYAADKNELTIKHKHEMDKTSIESYLKNRFKLDSSNASIQIISNSPSDHGNMNLYSKAEIKLVNGNVARGNLVIRAKGSHYIPDEYFFDIDYDSVKSNKWYINFHFNESSGLVTESYFPIREKMEGFVTTEYLNTIESNIRNGKSYLSNILYDLRYLIIPELMKNNKEGFIFFDFRNAMIHFEEDTIARKFL